MALTRVQTTPKASGSVTATLTFSSPPTVGNAIVIPLSLWSSTLPPTATDNYGNVYQAAIWQINGSNPRVAILYCGKINATGASFTITIPVSGTGYFATAAIEVTGLGGGTLQLDQATSNTGTSTTPSTGTTAALTGSEVFSVAAFAIANGQASITVDSVSPAWTQEYEELPFTNVPGEGDTRSRSSAVGATESCGWTCATTGLWAAAVAVFKVAATEARLSQDAIEILNQPVPAARVSQDVIEILGGLVSVAAPAVITQAIIELLGENPPPTPARITQALTELLSENLVVPARVTQLFAEVFRPIVAGTRTTQLAIEIFHPHLVPGRSTQAAIEYFQARSALTRTTQVVVEVFRNPIYNCPTDFPIDAAGAGGSCPTGRLPGD